MLYPEVIAFEAVLIDKLYFYFIISKKEKYKLVFGI